MENIKKRNNNNQLHLKYIPKYIPNTFQNTLRWINLYFFRCVFNVNNSFSDIVFHKQPQTSTPVKKITAKLNCNL